MSLNITNGFPTVNAGSTALAAAGGTTGITVDNDSSSTGAAWVFSQSNGGWAQQGNKLVGSNINDQEGGGGSGPQQGYSVALSYDGTTAFVGGIADNGYGTSCCYGFDARYGMESQQLA